MRQRWKRGGETGERSKKVKVSWEQENRVWKGGVWAGGSARLSRFNLVCGGKRGWHSDDQGPAAPRKSGRCPALLLGYPFTLQRMSSLPCSIRLLTDLGAMAGVSRWPAAQLQRAGQAQNRVPCKILVAFDPCKGQMVGGTPGGRRAGGRGVPAPGTYLPTRRLRWGPTPPGTSKYMP